MSLTFSVWQRPGEIYLGGEGEGGRETAAFIRGENIFKSRLGSLDGGEAATVGEPAASDEDVEGDALDERAAVMFSQGRYKSRIRKPAKERPGECGIVSENPDGSRQPSPFWARPTLGAADQRPAA